MRSPSILSRRDSSADSPQAVDESESAQAPTSDRLAPRLARVLAAKSGSVTPPTPRPIGPENRRARRKTCRNPATVVSDGLKQAISCTMCDCSATGALLEFGRQNGALSWDCENLPQRFVLNLPLDRVAFDCRLVWRNGKMAGVQYMGPARMLAKPQASRFTEKRQTGQGLLSRLVKG